MGFPSWAPHRWMDGGLVYWGLLAAGVCAHCVACGSHVAPGAQVLFWAPPAASSLIHFLARRNGLLVA